MFAFWIQFLLVSTVSTAAPTSDFPEQMKFLMSPESALTKAVLDPIQMADFKFDHACSGHTVYSGAAVRLKLGRQTYELIPDHKGYSGERTPIVQLKACSGPIEVMSARLVFKNTRLPYNIIQLEFRTKDDGSGLNRDSIWLWDGDSGHSTHLAFGFAR